MNSTSSVSGSARFAVSCALVILLSAFLLFQVQPVISKAILPWFGGSPAVWTTCMLFFQVLLLGGYAYAHWLTSRPAAFQQAVIHVVVLGLAILLLPIVPGESWKPTGSEHPTTRILLLLGVCVGLPYFALSSTGPLVQAWFSKVCPERSPYWLYALSNVGSLGALLSYPFVFEPMMSTRAQGLSWSAGFAVFAIACGALAMTAWRGGIEQRELSVGKVRPDGASDAGNASDLPPVADRLSWLGLPALASVFLLAVTNHLCQDVAVVPFMWVAPLSLYLLSFIFVFAGSRWYSRTWHGLAAAAALAGVACLQLEFEITQFITNRGWVPTLEVWEQRVYGWMDALHVRWVMVSINLDGLSLHSLNECIVVHASTYLAALFFVCMVCHGEMVRRRPASKWLTSFYMMTSAGGALGGIIVALICPAVFKTYLELNWAMTASYALLLFTLGTQLANRWKRSTTRRTKAVAVAASLVMSLVVACAGFIVGAQVESFDTDDLATARSFYGVLHVEEANQQSDVWRGRELMNGRILHGYQLMTEGRRRQPTTYYTRDSGAGLTIETLRRLKAGEPADSDGSFNGEFDDGPIPPRNADLPRDFKGKHPQRFAVVGLGVGTMAAYGEQGDTVRFYEINPQVVHFAKNYFSFLSDSPADVQVVLGDARLSMERQEPQEFDALILDAFSGDAIPVHLLTSEAIDIYRRHLKPTGVIAVHVSNRHLDLIPVVATLARKHQMSVARISDESENGSVACRSDWLLMTTNEAFLGDSAILAASSGIDESKYFGPLWTDQHSNLFEILK